MWREQKKFYIFDRVLPASLTDIADRLFCLLQLVKFSPTFMSIEQMYINFILITKEH